MESIGFSTYTIMSSGNSETFISCFAIWMPFISFSCLIAVARTSNTMLNRSGERLHPCLILHLSGKALSFCPFSMMLAVGLSYMASYYVEEFSLYSHFAECFYINTCSSLSNAFSTSIDMII